MRRTEPRPTRLLGLQSHPLILVLVAGILGLCACHSAPSKRSLQYMNQEGFGRRYAGNALEENYLTIGDTVRIADVLHTELTLTTTVDIDGTILLPEVGRLHVAGYTRSDLEAVLTERYAVYYLDPTEIVVDITTSSKVFWVLGEVRRGGEFEFRGNETVVDALVEASPNRDSANLGRVMLIRGDPNDPLRLPVNYWDITRGDTSTNYSLMENDIVWVPPTVLAELGYFIRQLIYPFTTVIQAISQAFFGFGNRGFRGGNQGGAQGFNQFGFVPF
ncbi:MAG: polysaccharide biosynthesis/export family protein [Planctomycetota bacterium]